MYLKKLDSVGGEVFDKSTKIVAWGGRKQPCCSQIFSKTCHTNQRTCLQEYLLLALLVAKFLLFKQIGCYLRIAQLLGLYFTL